MEKKKLYRTIIMDNYKNPSRFSKKIGVGFEKVISESSTCLDYFQIYVKFNNDIIEDIIFNGEGCSVSTASLNLVATYLIDKTKVEAVSFIDKYRDFIKSGNIDNFDLEDLIVFENVHIHLNRITCALIGPNSIRELLDKDD